jgi:DNA-binding MarR family transcriptional regulator
MDPLALIEAVERFKAVAVDIQAITMLTLLYVGQRGTCAQKDIEIALGVSHPATSRNVDYWTNKGGRGLDYMARFRDPHDGRANRVQLTPAGRAFYDELIGLCRPATTDPA